MNYDYFGNVILVPIFEEHYTLNCNYTQWITCSMCKGYGYITGTIFGYTNGGYTADVQKCPYCEGKGGWWN